MGEDGGGCNLVVTEVTMSESVSRGEVTFVEVVGEEVGVATVAGLAEEIWGEHYTPIIGTGQVAYMVGRFQSVEAIKRQIEREGFRYVLLVVKGRAEGYVGWQVQGEVLFLSKMYVRREGRGQGVGGAAMRLVMEAAETAGVGVVRVRVNRHNAGAIGVYERAGFARVKKVVTDIGGGYVMDDFVYEKEVRGGGG